MDHLEVYEVQRAAAYLLAGLVVVVGVLIIVSLGAAFLAQL